MVAAAVTVTAVASAVVPGLTVVLVVLVATVAVVAVTRVARV
ncbi:hypothetical protein CCO02nite_23210 [Cellulomonas composti]|uniref:Uncharacterized protein n=1 Tax=Cellulomonas composti TaxID=266130 RepID=A0A511JD74_9CELL|nr:hypothetical protein CCO02nite_23210 [Cellulomonas composti]